MHQSKEGQKSSAGKSENRSQGDYESEICYESLAKRTVEDVVMKKLVSNVVKHPELQNREFMKVLEAELCKRGKIEAFFTTDPLPIKSQNLSDGDCRTFLQCLLKENVEGYNASFKYLSALLECGQENCEIWCWKCNEKQKLHDLALYYGHFDIAHTLNVDISTISLCNAARHGNLEEVKAILETLKRNDAFQRVLENVKLSLCRAYVSQNRNVVDYLLNEGITLESHHIINVVEHGSMAVLKDVLEHLKYHNKWQPKSDADKVVYNDSKPPASEAVIKAFISEKFDMAEVLIAEGVEITSNVLPRVSQNGSYKSILRVMQHLEEKNKWDPKSIYASRALEVAYVMRKEDICELLIQEGIQISMQNIRGIVKSCSLQTVEKVIKSLKETNEWDPKSDCAIKALQEVSRIPKGDISFLLFQEGVPLTMENLPAAMKHGKPIAVIETIQNLKVNGHRDSQSEKASETLEYAYREKMQDDCDLLIKEGVTLKMKNFPGIVQDQTEEIIQKVMQTMKENGLWEPKSGLATEALDIALTKNKNYIFDLLIQAGVSSKMSCLDDIGNYASKDTLTKLIQFLKDTNEWKSESDTARKILENAFKRQDDDMSALLTEEGVSLPMEIFPDIVENASFNANRKVIQHLKDKQQWHQYSDSATRALVSAFKEHKYDICNLLIKEGVSLTMTHLLELLLIRSSECLFKVIQHLKCKNQWKPESECAYDAYINACTGRMYEVCELLTDMGVSLTMEKLPNIVKCGTSEDVRKVIQRMKSAGKWSPNSTFASDAFQLALSGRKNDTCDLLIEEGVSSAIGTQTDGDSTAVTKEKHLSEDPSKNIIICTYQPTVVVEIPFKFEKIKCIGSGAFGNVFECYDYNRKTSIAMKTLPHNKSKDEKKAVEQLLNEMRLLRKLSNIRIVQYLGCMDKDVEICIFMELMLNGSVKDYMDNQDKPLEGDILRKTTLQILEGLCFLHVSQVPPILHRDIKAKNILFDAEMNVKLADFGISKAINELTIAKTTGGNIKGSVYWMAPERLKENTYGTPADIWSVGCTVVEMLTNRNPWYNLEDVAAIFKIGDNDPETTPLDHLYSENFSQHERLPSALETFLQEIFKRKPTDRPSADVLIKNRYLTES